MGQTRMSQGRVARWLGDRSIRAKFVMVIAIGLVSCLGVALTAVQGMGRMQAQTEYLYSKNLVPVRDLGTMRASVQSMRIALLNGLIAEGTGVQAYLDQVKSEDAVFDKAFDAYRATDMTGREAAVKRLEESLAKYRSIRDASLVVHAMAHDVTAFRTVRDSQAAPVLTEVYASLDELVKIETASAEDQNRQAVATASRARSLVIVQLVVGLLVALGLGMVIARALVGAVGRVVSVAAGLGAGDLTGVCGMARRDEVGRMAAALDGAIVALRATVGKVREGSARLADASGELTGVSGEISTTAQETSSQAQRVSAAAEQVSRNVQTVAAATEQMGSSIHEIARNADQAAQVAQEAVLAASAVTATVSQLGESSVEIGNVLQMISSIAEQTNLLALNATIEAARAGEAGKGFAVVASEVKDLAQETGRATQDISGRIEAIQADTQAAIEAIGRIAGVIEAISGYTTTIASAVEEQTATTGEIGRNVGQAATGSGEIAATITDVASGAHHTTTGIDRTARAAEDLARLAGQLQETVSAFRL